MEELKTCKKFHMSKKFRNVIVEYLLGFEDGAIVHTTLSCNNEVTTPINREFKESGTIYSIFFIGLENYAYSAGLGSLYVTNLSGGTKKSNWYRINSFKEKEIVSNITKLTDRNLTGIVRNRLYVFNEYDKSYILCGDSKDVVGYSVDEEILIVLVFSAKKNQNGEYVTENKYYALQEILETQVKKYWFSNRQIYSASTRKMVTGKSRLALFELVCIYSRNEVEKFDTSVWKRISSTILFHGLQLKFENRDLKKII
uniref:Sema domain-containing protein n=1 Tax=Strongyloides papillosus TaxID=174720 RepID=A0A0N5BGE3_STREA